MFKKEKKNWGNIHLVKLNQTNNEVTENLIK